MSLLSSTAHLSIRRWNVSNDLIIKRDGGHTTKAKRLDDICYISSYNKRDDYVLTSLTKSEAIQLRDFLNEFIGDRNE